MRRTIVGLIPCFNVARHCEQVVRESSLLCKQLIAIDDGSTDGTKAILERLASQHPKNIHIIEFKKNRGKGFGLIEGFKYAAAHADFDALVTLDGDGQHFSRFIPHLAEPIFKGADLVIGSRPFNEMPIKNRFANSIITFLLRCVYPQAPQDTQSGMRAFSADLIQRLARSVKGGHYETEFRCLLLALKEKRRIKEVPIPAIYIDRNKSTHFAPWIDSFRILKVLFIHLIERT
jgi:glycosyltransferase involved in cell wall biosynthesis